MIIRKYGIELHRLTHDDIELVRQARNRDDIRRNMLDQRIISKEQQEAWFRSIDNQDNYYFILHHQGKKVGLSYGKNMDWNKRENEGGMFVWEPSLIGTTIPAKASILMMELSFGLIGLERTFARTNPDNPQARDYNLIMGYQRTPESDLLVLSRATYEANAPKLRRLAAGGRREPPLTIEDIEFPAIETQRHLYEGLPESVLTVFRPKSGI